MLHGQLPRPFYLAIGLWWTVAGIVVAEAPPKAEHDFAKWEQDIQKFEASDRQHSPQPGGVVFVGSSTMRLWKTDELLPDLHVVNRGFGGSEMIDSLHFAERIVLPHRPKVLVVYAGSNDLNKGVTSCEVLAHFEQFVAQVHAASPETEIVYMSINPSQKRWAQIHRIRATNALIQAKCIDLERVHFLETHAHLLNAAGEPEATYLSDDGLHLNDVGYRRLTELVRPTIERLLAGESDVNPSPTAVP